MRETPLKSLVLVLFKDSNKQVNNPDEYRVVDNSQERLLIK